jgi:thiol-disulfide isomerase/thioredoxin
MYCGHCGGKIAEDSQFCEQCGRPVEAVPGPVPAGQAVPPPADKPLRYIGAALVIIVLLSVIFFLAMAVVKPQPPVPAPPGTGTEAGKPLTVYFFYGEECPYCPDVMPFVRNMSAKYPDADIRFLELYHNQTNPDLFNEINGQLKDPKWGVPEVVIGDTALGGAAEIPAKLESLIRERLKK